MSRRELDAAGIPGGELRRSYELCRKLHAAHGKTYYLATRLLPPAKRPYVHALYGFARYADEFVDSLENPRPDALTSWSQRFLEEFDQGHSDDPVRQAAIHTAHTWGIPRQPFEDFLTSMCMDITVTAYRTYGDLKQYMTGSAAAIGTQMVPILEPLDARAYDKARTLGEAFQLTNFIRDVGDDLRRGRVYLPEEDLQRFGLARHDLAPGPADERMRNLLRFEIGRARGLYRRAEAGINMLHPSSRECISTAFTLYAAILEAVERSNYEVLIRRASVPIRSRLRVGGPALLRARRAWA